MNVVRMLPADLAELRGSRVYPAVSVLAPMHRHRPGNAQDPILLRDLADEAARRVSGELGPPASGEILLRLDDAVASVDWRNPPEAVAIFVAPGESRVLELPFTVPPRVVIDHTFATRDLIRGIARNPSYRVLALGEKPTRLFEGQGSNLVESRATGFPCFVEGARGEPLASGGFAAHSSRSEAQELSFFRDVDRALRVATEDRALPLVVAGTERDLAFFDEVTTHGPWIVGRITGNYESASPAEVARLALPFLDEYLASQRAASIRELAEAVGAGRTAVGVKAAWSAARAGRARALLVEEDFVYPAREVDGSLEPAGDDRAPGVIDDAIDELIEMVLDTGGDVVIVEPGELAGQGPVAVLLRYPTPERTEA